VVESGQLWRAICQAFDEEELRTLCFDLGLDYDALRGDGRDARARELVAYYERRGEKMTLVRAVQRHRPSNQFWAEATQDRTVPPASNQYATAKMLVLTVGRVETRMDAVEELVERVVGQVDRLRTVSAVTLTAVLFLVCGLVVVTAALLLR
jgi:hypothetical protein